MLQIGADLLVGALGVTRDPFEVLLDLGVVEDLEVVGRIDLPLEVVEPDPVLAEIRDVRSLGEGIETGAEEQSQRQQGHAGRRGAARLARAHMSPQEQRIQGPGTSTLRQGACPRSSLIAAMLL
jgi:hypothetical protein